MRSPLPAAAHRFLNPENRQDQEDGTKCTSYGK